MNKPIHILLLTFTLLIYAVPSYSEDGALLKLSTDVTIPNFSQYGIQELLFDSVVYNNGGFTNSAYPGRIVIPSNFHFSHVDIRVSVDWEASSTADVRQLTMKVERNGNAFAPDGRASNKSAAIAGNNLIQQA